MSIKVKIIKAFNIPFHLLLKKVKDIVFRKIKNGINKKIHFIFSTYSKFNGKILYRLNIWEIVYTGNAEALKFICRMYVSHRFDLLGSGWVAAGYGDKAFGLENYLYDRNIKFEPDNLINTSNRKIAGEIHSLIDPDYVPIDWQKDFKSGYRWESKKWYLDQRNNVKGADIKVPWELGRMQHMPQMALYALKNSKDNNQLIKEFKNHIIDFIALNPPHFGVQWACTMDVGIRAANMLLAYDIFLQIDVSNILNEQFRKLFAKSMYEHGLFIINNLEYRVNLTSNHYLSNIAGLLFISSHLENTQEINRWLAFSVQELISEVKKQYYEEGVNFEASTSYHRLSTEILVYATALVLGLPKEKINGLKNYSISGWKIQPKLKELTHQEYKIINDEIIFPGWYIKRLFNAGKFTYDISKPNGDVPQIGDNDSGRFFRLSPNGEMLTLKQALKNYKNLENYKSNEKYYWDENILNHQTLLAAFNGLFENKIFNTGFAIEKLIVRALANNRKLNFTYKVNKAFKQKTSLFNHLKYKSEKVFDIPVLENKSIQDGLVFIPYVESGIFIFKSDRLYLIVSAGPNGQNGNGGHAHNDKLSFELMVDGKNVMVDPGTYLYTPIPEKRNLFRSVKVHNTLMVDGEEQNNWIEGRSGLFNMKNQTTCYLLDYGENYLDVAVKYRNIKQRRQFFINKDSLLIKNYSNKEFIENYNNFKIFSNGYGKLLW